jgi:hypothetical protein
MEARAARVEAVQAGLAPQRLDPSRKARPSELILVALLSSGVTLWWLWPLPRVWGTQAAFFGTLPVVHADLHWLMWVLAWDSHAIATGAWWTKAPPIDGSYELTVLLDQFGDGPLARCGVQPVHLGVNVAAR